MSPQTRQLTRIGAILAVVCLCGHTVRAQQAEFTADITSGCAPLTVKFTDTSIGTPNSWQWDFGNGNASVLQNPSAVFTTPGTYNVTLTVSNGGGQSTRTKSAFIRVHDAPNVHFTFDVASGCAPLSVKFNDQTSTASGNITNWFWVFGDGGTSQSANPTYIYKQPGGKTISLKAINEHGCERTKTIESGIVVQGPITAFTPNTAANCSLPANFSFTNQATGSGTLTYQWTFGDGQSSTLKDPSHSYTTAGSYDVKLTTRDQNGCETSATHKVFAGTDGGIDFQPSAQKVCPGEPITFTASSDDPVVSYLWDFGNGTSATTAAPSVTYTQPGVYTVKLTAQLLNHACNSVISHLVEMAPALAPSFTAEADCNNNLKLASTSPNTLRVEWYINDALVSTAKQFTSPIHEPGQQLVKLVAYNAAECAYVLERFEVLAAKPVPSFKPNKLFDCDEAGLAGCAPFSVTFENETTGTNTYLWRFGDGATSTASNPSHTFTTKGLFQVDLVATDSRGCSGIATAFVKVSDAPPTGDFTIDKTTACAGEDITFTATTANADFWCWNFGDGGGGDGQSIIYKYATPGTYTVTLTARNGCNRQITRTNVITIKNPHITYSYFKTCDDPYKIHIENKSQNYDVINWDFGDGQTTTDMTTPSHTYSAEGEYTLRLIGTNFATGCTTIAYSNLTIQDVKADFSASTDKPCRGSTVFFTDQSTAATTWKWTFAGQESTDQDFSKKMTQPGDYTIKLEVEDSDGCTASKSMPIKVLDLTGEFSFSASSTCEDFTVNFTDASTGVPSIDTWSWNFGDGQLSNDRHPTHIYSVPGKYNVTLDISNNQGTCSLVKQNAVNFTVPEPDFVIGKEAYCPGEAVVIANTSKNAVYYEWDYGNGTRSDFDSPTITYTVPGKYDISLFARDVWGCERKIIKEDFVNVVKPVADFSVDAASGACPPFTATFHDKSAANIEKWQWAFGDGKTSELQNPANVYLKPGAFDVSLSVTDKYGCTDSKVVNQFVFVGGPSGSFSRTSPGVCTFKEITFTATTTNTTSHTWDFGDGVVTTKPESIIKHAYTATATYKPSLLLTDANGCKVVADGSTSITISDTTAIRTSVSPACIFVGDKIRFIGDTDSQDILTWRWDVDSVQVANRFDVLTSIDDPGLHYVTAYATNQFNCVSSITTPVRIQGPIDFIPNVITPNNDRDNETFTMKGLENSEWDLHVLNRWGTVVHKEENYQGTWNAGDQPAGVYYFHLRNRLCEGLNYKGYISVLK